MEQDPQQARKWLEKAAEQGSPEAQYYLGVMYYQGVGVEQDPQQARKWLEKAAVQEYPEAQYCLGLIYASGEGVKKDFKKAQEWWEKVNVQGNPTAQKNLEIIYNSWKEAEYRKAKTLVENDQNLHYVSEEELDAILAGVVSK